MTRFFLTLFAALIISPAAFAADDGGFGSQRFSGQAPVALTDEGAYSALAKDETNPALIEPAAGTEADTDADAVPEVEEAPSAIPAEIRPSN